MKLIIAREQNFDQVEQHLRDYAYWKIEQKVGITERPRQLFKTNKITLQVNSKMEHLLG